MTLNTQPASHARGAATLFFNELHNAAHTSASECCGVSTGARDDTTLLTLAVTVDVEVVVDDVVVAVVDDDDAFPAVGLLDATPSSTRGAMRSRSSGAML